MPHPPRSLDSTLLVTLPVLASSTGELTTEDTEDTEWDGGIKG
jgi:hypothetical protein